MEMMEGEDKRRGGAPQKGIDSRPFLESLVQFCFQNNCSFSYFLGFSNHLSNDDLGLISIAKVAEEGVSFLHYRWLFVAVMFNVNLLLYFHTLFTVGLDKSLILDLR